MTDPVSAPAPAPADADAALRADLDADAGMLVGDAAALRKAMQTPEWLQTIESISARVFPLVEPFLVAEAAGIGGSVAGAAAQMVGDEIAAKLKAMAPPPAPPLVAPPK